MNKKNKILVGCLALLLALSVGYALFSETITINGTATAKGNFDIVFECTGKDIVGNATGSCSISGQTITTTSNLTKPEDLVMYTITLTNNGTIPAKLKTISSSNNADENFEPTQTKALIYFDRTYLLYGNYEVEGVDMISTEAYDTTVMNAGIVLQPNESITIDVSQAWIDADAFDEDLKQPTLPANGVTFDYDITIGFEQVIAN